MSLTKAATHLPRRRLTSGSYDDGTRGRDHDTGSSNHASAARFRSRDQAPDPGSRDQLPLCESGSIDPTLAAVAAALINAATASSLRCGAAEGEDDVAPDSAKPPAGGGCSLGAPATPEAAGSTYSSCSSYPPTPHPASAPWQQPGLEDATTPGQAAVAAEVGGDDVAGHGPRLQQHRMGPLSARRQAEGAWRDGAEGSPDWIPLLGRSLELQTTVIVGSPVDSPEDELAPPAGPTRRSQDGTATAFPASHLSYPQDCLQDEARASQQSVVARPPLPRLVIHDSHGPDPDLESAASPSGTFQDATSAAGSNCCGGEEEEEEHSGDTHSEVSMADMGPPATTGRAAAATATAAAATSASSCFSSSSSSSHRVHNGYQIQLLLSHNSTPSWLGHHSHLPQVLVSTCEGGSGTYACGWVGMGLGPQHVPGSGPSPRSAGLAILVISCFQPAQWHC